MHAVKVSWVGQTFALAKCNASQGKKSRIRKSKEERKTMVEAFIKKYQASNNGNFPSLNLTHKEVGGSFYTVREIVREVIQENKILGPARSSSENQVINNSAVQNVLSLPLTIDLSQEDVTFIHNEHENTSDILNNEGHESVYEEGQEALMDHLSDSCYSGDLATFKSDRLPVNGSQHEVPAVSQVVVTTERWSDTVEEIDITRTEVMVENFIIEGLNNASAQNHDLMSAASSLTSDANPISYPTERFESAESTATMASHQNKSATMETDMISPEVMVENFITEDLNNASAQTHDFASAASLTSDANPTSYSTEIFEGPESTATVAAHQNKSVTMEVDFNFYTVAEATEKNNTDQISGGLNLKSSQMTLEDNGADSQNMVAAEAQVHSVAVNDAWEAEVVPHLDVDPKLAAFKIPVPNNVVPEQSSSGEEVNSNLDGTSSGSPDVLRRDFRKAEETNPFWAAIKSFIAAFIKFWEE